MHGVVPHDQQHDEANDKRHTPAAFRTSPSIVLSNTGSPTRQGHPAYVEEAATDSSEPNARMQSGD